MINDSEKISLVFLPYFSQTSREVVLRLLIMVSNLLVQPKSSTLIEIQLYHVLGWIFT